MVCVPWQPSSSFFFSVKLAKINFFKSYIVFIWYLYSGCTSNMNAFEPDADASSLLVAEIFSKEMGQKTRRHSFVNCSNHRPSTKKLFYQPPRSPERVANLMILQWSDIQFLVWRSANKLEKNDHFRHLTRMTCTGGILRISKWSDQDTSYWVSIRIFYFIKGTTTDLNYCFFEKRADFQDPRTFPLTKLWLESAPLALSKYTIFY